MLSFTFFRPSLADQLESESMVLPRLSHQKAWAERFAPELEFNTSLGSWALLQRYTVPLLKRHGSQAHNLGLSVLGLGQQNRISLDDFRERVMKKTGWRLQECRGEVPPEKYFEMLSQMIFPYVSQLRPVRGVLCNDRPDFWHEAVGHIAPLVSPQVSQFYQKCGERFCQNPSKNLEKIFWVFLEYGFVFEENQWKAFGAALTSSFVAMTKFQENRWSVARFDRENILKSGLFDQGFAPKRDAQGRITFFGLHDLDSLFENWGSSC